MKRRRKREGGGGGEKEGTGKGGCMIVCRCIDILPSCDCHTHVT